MHHDIIMTSSNTSRKQEEAARVQQARVRVEADLRQVARQHKDVLQLKVSKTDKAQAAQLVVHPVGAIHLQPLPSPQSKMLLRRIEVEVHPPIYS